LYAAVQELFPGVKLRIEHSVSKGYYCELDNLRGDLTIEDTFAIADRMHEIIDKDLPFTRITTETDEVIELFEAKGLT
ncbi:MAG TPA: AAA family ATPase, partial [Marinilabiliaceae bacterium]|nr:AAA family ATPase [Marinilabiliaceae bacterium]